MKHFNVVTLALASSILVSQAVADPLDDAIALFRRQSISLSTGVTITDSTPEDSTTTPPTTRSTTTPPSNTATPTGSSEPPVTATSTEFSTSTRTPTETSVSEEPTSQSEQTSQEEQTSRTRITSSATVETVLTFTTVTNGQTSIGTRTSQTVVPTETDVDPSSLSGGGSDGGSSGLSESAKKTIGGVVGGVGGALLLAGLGYTAWRIWGKKKNLHDEDAYDPNMAQDKLSSSTADNSTPFNRTLDQYHQPGPVNQASNF